MMTTVKKLGSFASLETIGIATEYFERYVLERPMPHQIDVVLLSLIVSGRGIHYLDRGPVAEERKSLTVTHYGEKHSIVSPTGMNILNLYLNLKKFELPPLGDGLDRYLAAFLSQHPHPESAGRICRIELGDDDRIEKLAFAIHLELTEKRTGYHRAAQEYFKLLLIECCRRIECAGLQEIKPDAATRRMWELRNYLESNFERRITLAELARRFKYQPNYLCRRFKSVHHEPIFDFLIKLRVRNAAWQLQHGEEKILTIALNCGFSDLSYFIRVFKQHYHCTPRQYRCQP